MCGIMGYVGHEAAGSVLLDGLKRMEYRGYDSAGIAVCSETGVFQIRKTTERVQALDEFTHGGRDLHGVMGIGHTRWATHGVPNEANAHPHVSEDGRIAVVHNGIVENYLEIKAQLMEQGITFASETDSEVIAQLLAVYYRKYENILEAVKRLLGQLHGSWALGILCSDYPNVLIAARNGSPLLLGFGEHGNLIASDAAALLRYTRDVVYMEDGEIAVVTAENIDLFDRDLQLLEKEHCAIEWDVSDAEKGGFPHFMYKEILEQPEAVRKTISPRIRNGRIVLDDISFSDSYLQSLSGIFIVACGSSYHVGAASKYNWERLLGRRVEVVLASEFRYSNPLVDEHTLVVGISQSGETLDTMAAMREAKRRGGRTLAVVNVVGSSIAREADDVLYTWAGPEIAVATTKGYSTQLALMDLIGLYLADRLGRIAEGEYGEILAGLQMLPEQMRAYLEGAEDVRRIATRWLGRGAVFFIGRNLDYAIAMEGSLKLKEISYIHSGAYAAGELKHGTISLVEPGTLVVAVGAYAPLFEKTMNNIVEVKSRGATVLAITTESLREPMEQAADETLTVPEAHPLLQPSLSVLPLQLLAYYVGLERGCDIDHPRNLAKSVTVE